LELPAWRRSAPKSFTFQAGAWCPERSDIALRASGAARPLASPDYQRLFVPFAAVRRWCPLAKMI